MDKNENCMCKACKSIAFHWQICKFVTFLLPSSSWLHKLPVVRCRGRIKNCSLNQEGKTPVLIPSKHQAVDLIISKTHDRMLHSGHSLLTLTMLRDCFWIIRGGKRSRFTKCVKCRREEGRRFSLPEPMATNFIQSAAVIVDAYLVSSKQCGRILNQNST